MFSHCIYCKSPLGTNPVIESFPVGRRLAFDEQRARLWVVCDRCSRWNLSPLEDRWEVIETCERLFRTATRRVSTDQIGLGALPQGLELVRIGKPQRPELAAWRYGGSLLKRRKRQQLESLVSVGIGAGAIALSVPIFWPLLVPAAVYQHYREKRVVARVAHDDDTVLVRRAHAQDLSLLSDGENWALQVKTGEKRLRLSGDEALGVAGRLLPFVNQTGAGRDEVERAVRELERRGTGGEYFHAAAGLIASPRGAFGRVDMRIAKAPPTVRLALEMAAHEDAELRALNGELHRLEAAWREAEEIAAIADDLLLPSGVREALERLRHGFGGWLGAGERADPNAAERTTPHS